VCRLLQSSFKPQAADFNIYEKLAKAVTTHIQHSQNLLPPLQSCFVYAGCRSPLSSRKQQTSITMKQWWRLSQHIQHSQHLLPPQSCSVSAGCCSLLLSRRQLTSTITRAW
jgi:hypothetical protein